MIKKALILTTISGFLTQFEINDVLLLKELGYEIHYASNFRHPVYDMDKIFLDQQEIKLYQIDIEKSPLHMIRNTEAFYQICEIIRTEKIQLIHCHNPMGGVLGRLAAFLCGGDKIKIVYTAHGFHFYEMAPILNWLLFYPVEALLARMTDCLITINHEDYKRARSFKMKDSSKIVLIPGVGVKTNQFQPNADRRMKLRKKLGMSDQTFYIVSVGELNKNKNHEVIIKAISMLKKPNIQYAICGQGKQKKKLKKLIEKLGLEKQVKLLGFRKDIADILQTADCFAFPSKREGLGIAAIEAMAAGLPLLTSDCRGTREYMKNQETGFVCKEDSAKEYAEKIRLLMEQKPLAAEMGRNCMIRAGKFDLAVTDQIMRKTYRELTAETP